MSSINPESIWVLSALDKFMATYKANANIFNKLFEKKKAILQLIQNGKIDAKKYKVIVAKAFKDEAGDIKKCAEEDLLKCKDGKDDKMVELWFREIIENTGQPYEWQEQQYSLNNKSSNIQKNTVSAQKKESQSGVNIEILVSFKSIDSLMQQNQGNRGLYTQLLERKQKLLALVKNKTLTAEKYKATLTAYISKINNEELISDYKFQLEGIQDFHDGNVGAWFKEIIDQSVDKLQEQNSVATGKKNVRQQSVKIQQKKQITKPEKPKPAPVDNTTTASAIPSDLSSLCSLKAIDDLLENLTHDKVKYKQVLTRKRKILELIGQGLSAQKYKGELIKAYKNTTSQAVKESIKFELEDLTDLYENNLQEWFKQSISTAKLQLDEQQQILQKLQKGQKIKPRKADDDDDESINLSDDEDINIDSDDDNLEQAKPASASQAKKAEEKPKAEQKQKKQVGQSKMVAKLGLDIGKVTSLKALDEFMSENEKDISIFCICFQRKQQIFELMKKGEITPAKYKQLQQSCIKESDNERLKQIIQMDLFDLKDMCSNNVDEWFESLINDTGMLYQEQQEKYQKLKSNKQDQKQQTKEKKEIVKPSINQVVCFSAICLLIEHCLNTKDVVYYEDIKGKRERLMDLVLQKKLNPSKYRQLNKATISKTTNQFLKSAITNEESLLSSKFGNKQQDWFSYLCSQLSKQPSSMVMPQNQQAKAINAASADKKKLYLIQKMSPYESLLNYYNKNELLVASNKYLQDYQKVKKPQMEGILAKIQKNSQIDIYSLGEQLFPPIREAIFFGQDVSLLKKKAEKVIQLLSQQITAIKDYSAKIKKSTNAQNLEDCKKQLISCEQTITYLKTWPEGLTAFPRVKEEKKERYNLDPIKYLDLNEIEIEVTHIVGVKRGTILKIYVADFKNARFFSDVQDGTQKGVRTIVKISTQEMLMILNGKKMICFKLFEKGFFGGLTQIGESTVEGSFARNNINEQKVQVGCSFMNYTLRVHKPNKPLITEITSYEVVKLPRFQDDPNTRQELITKYQKAKLL